MSDKPVDASDAVDVEDLTIDKKRLLVLNLDLEPEQIAALQAQADRRGVTIEEFLRGIMVTTAAVTNAGGDPNKSGGTA